MICMTATWRLRVCYRDTVRYRSLRNPPSSSFPLWPLSISVRGIVYFNNLSDSVSYPPKREAEEDVYFSYLPSTVHPPRIINQKLLPSQSSDMGTLEEVGTGSHASPGQEKQEEQQGNLWRPESNNRIPVVQMTPGWESDYPGFYLAMSFQEIHAPLISHKASFLL